MKTRNMMIKAIPLLFAIFAVGMTGCSYVVDAIEGAIMNRSSFSIEASYNGGFVDISWDESGGGEAFAGWEIYMTKEPDDEYAGYAVVAARYDLEPLNVNIGESSTITFVDDAVLALGAANSFSLNVGGINPGDAGVYFFRVGKIHWDEEDQDKRDDDFPTWASDEGYYEGETNIGAISGQARVEIP